MITAINASGMFIKKINRHKPKPANQPPNAGPMIVVNALKVDQVPKALPLLLEGIIAEMIARLPGTIKAPPTP